MIFEWSHVWLLTVIMLLGILLLFSYLQIQYRVLMRSPFGRPKRGLLDRLKTNQSLFTKLYIAYRWFYVRNLHGMGRALFTRPELSLVLFALIPLIILSGYWAQYGISPEPLVLVTLFYASIIFLKEIFLVESPLVVLNPTMDYKDGKLTVDYITSNIGSKPISNLSLNHAIYDGNGRLLGTSTPLNYRNKQPLSLAPGETSEEFRIPLEKSVGFKSEFDEWNEISDETPRPILVEISASPSIGHRFLGDREMLRIDPIKDIEQRRQVGTDPAN